MASTRRTRRTRATRPKVALPKPRKGRKLPPGIVRLDYERAKGYMVRLAYRETPAGYRPRFRRYFSDVKYGGARRALTAARAWLDQVVRTGKVPPDPRG